MNFDDCIEEYRQNRHHLEPFAESIRKFFSQHPALTGGEPPVLHSVRMRMKNDEHLRDKLRRKALKGDVIVPRDLLAKVNDLAGVRLVHLYQAQFRMIHDVIQAQLTRRDWVLHEPPVAYTWDPESRQFFENFGLRAEVKESFYTSIHYVLKPRADSPLCCELQVRTLFEEAWGEIDHGINYPTPTTSSSAREQIRVLSRLVGAGTRLADSIFRAEAEHRATASPPAAASLLAAAASGAVAPAPAASSRPTASSTPPAVSPLEAGASEEASITRVTEE